MLRSLWLRIALAVGALVLAGAVAAPFLIPVDDYRPLLVSAMEGATGRQVEIDKLKLSVFPNLRISLVNFRMRNPKGFPAGDVLTARSIDLAVKLKPLLSRHLVVTHIAPSGVELNFIRDAAGHTNLSFAPRRGSGGGSLLTLEHVGEIAVKDAAIFFFDEPLGKEPSYSISGANGTISGIDPRAANWIENMEVAVNLAGARMSSSLLTKPLDFRSGAFSFRGNSGRGTLSAAIGNLDLSGEVAFEKINPLALKFALKSPDVDLNTLPDLFHSGAKSVAHAERRLLAQGTIATDRLTFVTLRVTRVAGRLSLYSDAVQLDNCSFTAYGGSVHGSAILETAKAGLPATSTLQVRGMSIASLLAAVDPTAHGVGGALDADMRIGTLLARNPEQTLTSSGTFAIRNGTLPSAQLRRFSYLGGDLRIAHERGYSNDLQLLSSELRARGSGSFGFDQSVSYRGTAVVNAASRVTDPQLQTIVAQTLQANLGTSQVSVPFYLYGNFENPQVKITGTPQLVNAPKRQNSSLPATVNDLLKLFPGQ